MNLNDNINVNRTMSIKNINETHKKIENANDYGNK